MVRLSEMEVLVPSSLTSRPEERQGSCPKNLHVFDILRNVALRVVGFKELRPPRVSRGAAPESNAGEMRQEPRGLPWIEFAKVFTDSGVAKSSSSGDLAVAAGDEIGTACHRGEKNIDRGGKRAPKESRARELGN